MVSAVAAHSTKVVGLFPSGLSVWNLYVLTVSAWVKKTKQTICMVFKLTFKHYTVSNINANYLGKIIICISKGVAASERHKQIQMFVCSSFHLNKSGNAQMGVWVTGLK